MNLKIIWIANLAGIAWTIVGLVLYFIFWSESSIGKVPFQLCRAWDPDMSQQVFNSACKELAARIDFTHGVSLFLLRISTFSSLFCLGIFISTIVVLRNPNTLHAVVRAVTDSTHTDSPG